MEPGRKSVDRNGVWILTFSTPFRLYQHDPQVRPIETLADLFDMVDAELKLRRETWPELVRKGRMDRPAAVHQLRIWSAIFDQLCPYDDRPRRTGKVASWADQVRHLRDMIQQRRRDDTADPRALELIESLHDLIWTHDKSPEAIAGRAAMDARAAA